jgi:hypothetical protein
MSHPDLRKGIFEWINRTLLHLSSKPSYAKPFTDLKEALQRSVKELISINDGESVALLDKWFEDSY